jgi:predicted Zn-dependent protease
MVNFFTSLQKMGDMSGQGSLPGFLSTHPLNSERIQNVTKMLTAADASLAVKRDAYLQSINNIVYGNDPRQGYVENNAFYHPGLRFVFDIPAGWKAQNTPSRVTLVSKDEQAAVVLAAEKSSEDLKTYAGRKASELEGGQLLGEQSLVLNGLSSYHRLYSLPRQENSTLKIRMSFIRKAGFIFTLAALSPADAFVTYDTSFQGVLRSFKDLTDAGHINRPPRRLKLVRAGGGQTLQALFQASGMNKDTWPKMAMLNEMELGDVPKSGQWVKIIR